jgi:hypothetical protein
MIEMDINLTWKSAPLKINSVKKAEIKINLYWQSEPLKIKENKLKGEPILNLTMGLFKDETNSVESKDLISKDLNNALITGSDDKLYVAANNIQEDGNIDYLAYYILSKN